MSNPTLSATLATQLARSRGCPDLVLFLGMRGANSKYGEYDDTIGLITPEGYAEFKFNTLPSKWESGIACLQPGDYDYIQGLHGQHHFFDLSASQQALVKPWLLGHVGEDYPPIEGKILPYWAFRQAGPVTVLRDGETNPETIEDPNNWPWIDLHCGGWNGTSSLGCQTWYPDHWKAARAAGFAAMNKYGQKKIKYCLHLMDA